jgi:hypothetical protein
VLIAIVSCAKYENRRDAQLETWARWPHSMAFFDGPDLGVGDDYASLPRKTEALCKWALARGHDRILKIDDDGYINWKKFSVVEADYAGIRKPGDYASGGAYWLSRRSMEIVARYGINDEAEDRGVGKLLAEHGIRLTDIPYILAGAGVAAEYGCPCGSDKCKAKSGPIWEYFPEAAVITQLGPDQMRACHRFYEDTGRNLYL